MTAQDQYMVLKEELNEKQWRHFLATEALKIGYGGINQVMVASQADWKTIKKGITEIEQKALYRPGERIRKSGGGRKKIISKDATLLSDLDRIIDPKGDPMTLLKYTTKSLVHLTEALRNLGHTIRTTALRRHKEITYTLGWIV